MDLNAALEGCDFELTCRITDPGSDDETVTCDYGSQSIIITYPNNPPDLDPYPSPDIDPVDITDTNSVFYKGPGTLVL